MIWIIENEKCYSNGGKPPCNTGLAIEKQNPKYSVDSNRDVYRTWIHAL